jgi:ribose transport system permease protein
MENNSREEKGFLEACRRSSFWTAFKEKIFIVIALVIICIIFSFLTSKFLTQNNILTVLLTVSINAILCYGMTFVLLIKGIDLSVGAIMAFSGTVTVLFITNAGIGTIPSILLGLLIGALWGLLNAIFITKLNLGPVIVTLATQYIIRGFAYVVSNAIPVRINDELFINIGNMRVLQFGENKTTGIPILIIYMFIIFIILWLVLNKAKFGRRIYAIGGNETAAKFSGINIAAYQMTVYVIMGFLAGFCGIIQCSRLYSGQPTIGIGAEMDAIAAAIIGGTSMSGGIGTLSGSMIGAFIIGVINNGLTLLNVESFWQMIAKGAIILLAVYIDMLKYRKKV